MAGAKRLGVVVAGLALIVLAVVMKSKVPDDYDHRYAPLAASGGLGSTIATGLFTLKVEGVRAARSIKADTVPRTQRPDGVFLIVTASATSRRPLRLMTLELHTADGRVYRPTTKPVTTPVNHTLDESYLGPGLWTRGVVVFETPADALPGSRLVVSDRPPGENTVPAGYPPFGFELSAQADVDLGITGPAARRLVSGAPKNTVVKGDGS